MDRGSALRRDAFPTGHFVAGGFVFRQNYYELLSAAPGNTGLFVGQPGDGRTVGLALRLALKGS